MTPNQVNSHELSGEAGSYRQAILAAYTSAPHLHPGDLTEGDARRIQSALLAHAATDEEAARQAEIEIDQLHHDRTALDTASGLPLLIAATTPGVTGRFYFSKPEAGWPRPGHRHPSTG